MAESSKPAPTGPDHVEQEFAESLRQAAYVFENEKDGRFRGSILACRTVARFIHQRNGGAELAAPFLQIAMAFQDLERGGKPRLFSKKSTPEKERERSPNENTFSCSQPSRSRCFLNSSHAALTFGTTTKRKEIVLQTELRGM
jgi:hypothetical protein